MYLNDKLLPVVFRQLDVIQDKRWDISSHPTCLVIMLPKNNTSFQNDPDGQFLLLLLFSEYEQTALGHDTFIYSLPSGTEVGNLSRGDQLQQFSRIKSVSINQVC